MRIETRKIIMFIVFLLCIALVAAFLLNLDKIFGEGDYGYDGSATEHKKKMDTVYIDGVPYLPREGVKNYLIIGVDEFGEVTEGGVAQADFITVLSINSKNNSYTVLSVNRDTMTEVDVLDVFGNKSETRVEQIALSHAYGSPFEISNFQKCKNTENAVSKLLYGVKFDGYISLTMDALKGMVDFLGGVKITVEVDLSEFDERFVLGEEVLLDGDMALTYIRARGGLEDSSNISRMKRQETFIRAFIKRIAENKFDDSAVIACYNRISSYIVTDSGAETIDEMTGILASCDSSDLISIKGEAREKDHYMAFYVDEEALKKTVTEVFFSNAN
jgi:LCP family protein required for cell wall assembly